MPCSDQRRRAGFRGMEEVDRRELFRRTGEQFSTFFWNRKLAMYDSGQCLVGSHTM